MKTYLHYPLALALLGTAFFAATAGCTRESPSEVSVRPATPRHPPGSTELHAVAQLEPTQGQSARGAVYFRTEGDAVRVTAELTGLAPGEHGIHVHEHGDCSAPDASSAGGHFNPTGQPHGARDAEARHVGDLGNIKADSEGRAELNYLDPHLALTGPNSVVGRAVVVHAGRDDLKSQPSGNSGARVACGAIDIERQNF